MLRFAFTVCRGLIGFLIAYVAGKYLDGLLATATGNGGPTRTLNAAVTVSAPLWVFIVAAVVACVFAFWPMLRHFWLSPSTQTRFLEAQQALFGGISAAFKAFQMVDARDLSTSEFDALEKVVMGGWLVYVVWFQIESHKEARRAREWRFSITNDQGQPVQFKIMPESWSAPPSWPNLDYLSLDEVQNNYIQVGRVYNVKFHLAVESDGRRTKDAIRLGIHFKDGFKDVAVAGAPQ